MKRNRLLMVLAVAMILMSCIAIVPAMAAGNGRTCLDLFEEVPFLGDLFDHDTCVTCVNNGNNAHVCVCKILDDLDALGVVGAKNFGQCVKALK